MANNLFTLDEMDPDRDVKKLRHVVRLHKSFKSQKNGDINRSRSVLWWGRKGINNRIWKDMCPFQKRLHHLLLVANSWTFFPFFNGPFFLQCSTVWGGEVQIQALSIALSDPIYSYTKFNSDTTNRHFIPLNISLQDLVDRFSKGTSGGHLRYK